MSGYKKVIKSFISAVLTVLARALAVVLNRFNIDIRKIHDSFYQYGFHFIRRHYEVPIPEEDDLAYERNLQLVGIDMNDDLQAKFLNDVILKYKNEFNKFPIHETDNPQQFYLVNGNFMAGDANTYYSLIHYLKPKTIIEIGSGNSTLLAIHAIDKNMEEATGEGEYNCSLISIDAYPRKSLLEVKDHLKELKKYKVQEVELDYFNQLVSGDILFIDSSHVLRSGGDVWWEYCEILPRLKKGVYVHVHDISLPKPYHRVYYDTYRYYNEQYLLQALLTYSSKFEVIWASTYFFDKYPEKLACLSPEYELMREAYPLAEPSSFWIRVK